MSKKKLPPISEEELNRYHQRFVLVVESVRTLALAVIWAMTILGFGYTAIYLPIQVSAGKETIISVTQAWLADVKMDVILAWGTGAAGVGYGLLMRRKMIRERTQKDSRISELEKAIDPGRTSSGLDAGGKKAKKGPAK